MRFDCKGATEAIQRSRPPVGRRPGQPHGPPDVRSLSPAALAVGNSPALVDTLRASLRFGAILRCNSAMVRTLNEFIIRQSRSAKSEAACHAVREEVCIIRSPGLDAATVALPAGIDLESRADRMKAFWRALVEFQDRDVLVVVLCVDDDHPR